MNYLPRNRTKHLQRQKIIILLVLFVALALFFRVTRGLVVSVIAPVWHSENVATRFFRSTLESLKSKNALAEENLSLKAQISSLSLEIASMQLAASRERSFSELLGRELRRGEIVASVLTRPPQSPYDLFVVDAGSSDGVVLEAEVALPEGARIGRVVDVFNSNSKVKLFTSSGEKTEAILERDNTPVVLEGRGGGNFRIRVAREINVVVGDRIVSPDVGYALLGVVESVEAAPTDAFKEVLARSPANIFSIRFVKILP